VTTLTLTLRQPAQLGDRPRDDFVLTTMEHLPGAAVRGALAAAWIAMHGKPTGQQRAGFLRLFEGGVRFGALLRPGTEFDSLAVVRHKYKPAETCQVVDYDRAVGDAPPDRCPDCDSPLEPARPGLFPDDPGDAPAIRRRTSVAIGESGVARRNQLFTRETLLPGQHFTGTLAASDLADLTALQALGQVRIGGRRTTHGLADITISEEAPPEPQRLDETTLVLRLRTPGIFTDEYGRPRPQPGRAELTRILGGEAWVERRWARWQEVGGWHVASGLPKPAELAVAAGSAFIIRTERAVATADIQRLARRGVGLRRHEGFGDLAGSPRLRDGMAAVQARQRHTRKLRDAAAPLFGIPVRFPARWPELKSLLAGHADAGAVPGGDVARRLRQLADEFPDRAIADALRAFLSLPASDAAAMAVELGRL
jgi:CRISPR-associated protein Csx10